MMTPAMLSRTLLLDLNAAQDWEHDGRGIGGKLTYQSPPPNLTTPSLDPHRLTARQVIREAGRHDFEQPLASTRAGSLILEQDDIEFRFMARLRDLETQSQYMIETLKMMKHGLLSRRSPGFNVVQEREVAGLETHRLAAVELAANCYGKAFASAKVQGSNALTPAALDGIGRSLIR